MQLCGKKDSNERPSFEEIFLGITLLLKDLDPSLTEEEVKIYVEEENESENKYNQELEGSQDVYNNNNSSKKTNDNDPSYGKSAKQTANRNINYGKQNKKAAKKEGI